MGTHEDARRWYMDTQIRRCSRALTANGFEVSRAGNRDEARQRVLDLIPSGAEVALGGSASLQEISIAEFLTERGFTVHQSGDRRKRLTSDVFISSTNALTMDGKLVNVDGSGTRVNAMIFGPKITIVVAGINKIVRNADEGLWRTRNVAAPILYHYKQSGTPCSELGYCTDCQLPVRQCRVTTILDARPRANTDFHVIIVEEALGY